MSRAKTKGGGAGNVPARKSAPRIPTDVADAAEAALDDLLATDDGADDEMLTQAISGSRMIPGDERTTPKAPAVTAKRKEESTVDAAPQIVDIADDPATVVPGVTPGATRAESEVSSSSALRVLVVEDQVHIGSVQSAIAAAGHMVVAAFSGRDGMKKAIEVMRERTIDVLLVALTGADATIDAALALEGRRPVVIACVDGNPVAATQRAVVANADLVAVRPHDVGSLTPILFAATRLLVERRLTASARGAEQALRARLDELADPEPRGLLPYEMFQRVLELEIKRAKRFEYALSVALFAVEVVGASPPPGIRGILRARAGNALIHTIRDIDVATQLDHERFLVLLPYTDLKGASGLARRVIAAVAALDPVVTAGRALSPKLVGAVAGAHLGDSLSFAKLMKDASRALEDARRDGADFAVQP